MRTRISEIEERILGIEKLKKRTSVERGLSGRGIPEGLIKELINTEDKSILEEREQLELERRFLIDRRENFIHKLIWLVLGAIFVIATQYILSLLGVDS